METIRVLVVDDQLAFRDVAQELIDATPGFEWIGSASSGEDGVTTADRLRPDLVLMDVRMPGIGGIEAARQITSRGHAAAVVLMTAGKVPGHPTPGADEKIISKDGLGVAVLTQLWRTRAAATSV